MCLRDLIELYPRKGMAVIESRNRYNLGGAEYIADVQFMGAPPNSPEMGALVEFMTNLTETDKTAQADFLGTIGQWCDANERITKISAAVIGACTGSARSKPIMLEDLMSNQYLSLSPHAYGIYIPSAEILSRTKYAWFANLSKEQVLESNTIIGKYLMIANDPEKRTGKDAEQTVGKEVNEEWLSYWQASPSVTSSDTGSEPVANHLGNRVETLVS